MRISARRTIFSRSAAIALLISSSPRKAASQAGVSAPKPRTQVAPWASIRKAARWVIKAGRFGPYVNWGKINATLPRDADPTSLTLEDAVTLLAAKAQGGGGGARAASSASILPAATSFCAKAASALRQPRQNRCDSEERPDAGDNRARRRNPVDRRQGRRAGEEESGIESKAREGGIDSQETGGEKSSGQESNQGAGAKGQKRVTKKAGSKKAGAPGKIAENKRDAKPALPSRAEILAFIGREQAQSPTKIGKREIARAFSITGADRIGLKKILQRTRSGGRRRAPSQTIAQARPIAGRRPR